MQNICEPSRRRNSCVAHGWPFTLAFTTPALSYEARLVGAWGLGPSLRPVSDQADPPHGRIWHLVISRMSGSFANSKSPRSLSLSWCDVLFKLSPTHRGRW
jgi:hypothetical protein